MRRGRIRILLEVAPRLPSPAANGHRPGHGPSPREMRAKGAGGLPIYDRRATVLSRTENVIRHDGALSSWGRQDSIPNLSQSIGQVEQAQQ